MKKKLTINTLALGNLRQRKKQYRSLAIGIILAMVFSSGVPFFISCMKTSQEEARFIRQGKQDIIIVNAQNYDFSPAVNKGEINGEIGYAHVLSYAWNENVDESYGTMIGWLDDRALELYYSQIIEGRMPEKEGEIIFEKNALQRMKIDATVGEKITLKTLLCNGNELFSEEKDKTYTLVGIMADKKSWLEHFSDEAERTASYIPAAFVVENTVIEVGGKEALVAFFNEDSNSGSWLWNNIDSGDRIDTDTIYSVSIGDKYSEIANNTTASAFISVLLGFMSCFGIVNAFSSNLKERKSQIGMLKAVGATRRQIINIFGREAFIISVLSAPVSVAISYIGVKLFALIMGDSFIFKPDIAVLVAGTLFGVICVMLSALIPLVSISLLSPMQAIRDIEFMRKMKNKKIRSQINFNVPELLAERKLIFSRARTVSVCIMIACSLVISCSAVSFVTDAVSEVISVHPYDYIINDNLDFISDNGFINFSENNSELSENSKYEILELDEVRNVYGSKKVNINIVFDEEMPEYLQINEYVSYARVSSRFNNMRDVLYKKAHEAQQMSGGKFISPSVPEVTRENIKEYMQAEPAPDYIYTKQVAGFTTEELFNTSITVSDSVVMNIDEDDIIDGEINYKKLNSGEEVIIYAPEKIGFLYNETANSSIFGIYNLSAEEAYTKEEKELFRYMKAEAQSPFNVGDILKLSLICSNENGEIIREDKEVKIGAILGKKSDIGGFSLYTTTEGFDKFSEKFNYNKLFVYLKEECTAEIDEQMQTNLSAMFPGKYVGSAFAMNEAEKHEFTTITLSLVALILVFIMISISLVNNSISAQIRDGKRTIGTLRAVGASEKDLLLSYIIQIVKILLCGFLAGIILYVVSYRYIGLIFASEYLPFSIWPSVIVFIILSSAAFINLKVRIRYVTKQSIVENIREL